MFVFLVSNRSWCPYHVHYWKRIKGKKKKNRERMEGFMTLYIYIYIYIYKIKVRFRNRDCVKWLNQINIFINLKIIEE